MNNYLVLYNRKMLIKFFDEFINNEYINLLIYLFFGSKKLSVYHIALILTNQTLHLTKVSLNTSSI